MAEITIDNATLERHLKKTTIISNVLGILVALVTALSVGYSFYYRTAYTQQLHSQGIEQLKSDVKEIKIQLDNTALTSGVSNAEIDNLKERMSKIESGQVRIEEKIDKILFQTRR
jgi:hypothetical protein